jgi:hypothetical protein
VGALWGRSVLAAVAAAGWLGISGIAAQAAVPSGNLIVNGGAEVGTGSSDSSTTAPVPTPGWATTTNFTEHTYDPAGSSNFPDVNASAAIGGGNQFFAGGPANSDNTVETATQNVAVSTAATEIDAGSVSATLSADLGGFATQTDNAGVTATFLGSDGQQLGTLTIGPVTAADRNDVTALLLRTGSATLPASTRTIRVVITAIKVEGSYNDAYIDNVSLSLGAASGQPPPPSGQLPAPTIGKTLNVGSITGKVFVRLPGGKGFVPLTQPVQLPVGTKVDARKGTISLITSTGKAGKTQTGKFGGALFVLAQSRNARLKGLTTLSLIEGVRGVPSYASCKARRADDRHGSRAVTSRVSSRVLALLHSSVSGHFRTRGRYAAATVRGTVWDMIDRCDGTVTRVHRGTVVVNDLARHKTVTVRAGHSYLAKAP